MEKQARKAPDFLNHAVLYQLFLRPFTPEGTFASAGRLLPHLKKLGVDIIYLCPVNEADGDPDPKFWSPRQIQSGLHNPKNPYRIANYETIDAEYGSEEEFREFIRQIHALGMRIIMDFVYFHCGPTCTLIREHPDYVKLGPNGEVVNGPWCFPALNFDNPSLRRYLIGNMRHFVEDFGIDGCRIDVGTTKIPLDFFVEARKVLESIRPDILMISESNCPDDQLEAFDVGYSPYGVRLMGIFEGKETTAAMSEVRDWLRTNFPKGVRLLNFADNHDVASDAGEKRFETLYGADAKRAFLAAVFSFPGVPMLYNGEEVADTNRHSIFANRFYPGNFTIDWQNSLTERGRERLAFLRKLTELRHTIPAFFTDADVEILDQESLVLIRRNEYWIAVNPHRESAELELPGTPDRPLLEQNARICGKRVSLDGYGFVIVRIGGR